jgi:hypothetical protein
MRRIAAVTAMVTLALLAATGCGSSGGSSASSPSTTQASAERAGSSTTVAASGTSTTEFCSMLATATGKVAGLAASIGTPEQTAKLAEVKADNDAIVAAAPADIHDAVATFYAVSELAQQALDPSLSASERASLGSQAATQAGSAEAKAAIADYTTWVTANCGDLATEILSGGV